jgi:hypothetical protein
MESHFTHSEGFEGMINANDFTKTEPLTFYAPLLPELIDLNDFAHHAPCRYAAPALPPMISLTEFTKCKPLSFRCCPSAPETIDAADFSTCDHKPLQLFAPDNDPIQLLEFGDYVPLQFTAPEVKTLQGLDFGDYEPLSFFAPCNPTNAAISVDQVEPDLGAVSLPSAQVHDEDSQPMNPQPSQRIDQLPQLILPAKTAVAQQTNCDQLLVDQIVTYGYPTLRTPENGCLTRSVCQQFINMLINQVNPLHLIV